MKRALVVVESEDHARTLIREAGELADGVGAELLLLTLMDRDGYEQDLETMATIANIEGTSYTTEDVKESGRQYARDLAKSELDGLDIEYEPVAAIIEDGDEAHRIVAVAEEKDCDHIFIVGRKRSPTGKAIFGDTAQRVILDFGGIVSVVTA
ncbi:universal stress protein [Natronobiforma cellulositropha]|uniref:universal stress protein n=1 Tax=Natronobiforma cellulositropha TaxID=1679076 RepID=UPI0021D5AF7C|nr:universal stress protein [Natronobiforma cellulositropha]